MHYLLNCIKKIRKLIMQLFGFVNNIFLKIKIFAHCVLKIKILRITCLYANICVCMFCICLHNCSNLIFMPINQFFNYLLGLLRAVVCPPQYNLL